MVSGDSEESALGSARGRFLESLPRKAVELRSVVAQLREAPDAEGPREDLRRRLHALYASALVFRNDPLARAVQECIDRLDAAREADYPLSIPDVDLFEAFVRRLPDLREDHDAEDARPHEGIVSEVVRAQPSARGAAVARPAEPVPLLQRILRVLLLPALGEESELLELLRSESLRVSTAASVAEVLAAVQADAPDLVLANEQLAYGGALVGRLRADAATDFVPVVLFEDAYAEPPDVPIDDVDARVSRPLRTAQLVQAIGRVTGTMVEPLEPPGVGDVTLEQLTDRVARELRRGLVDGAERGRSLSLAMGDGTEVLAVTHEAIAALRAAVVRESMGRVAFEARPRRGTLSLVTVQKPRVPRGEELRLNGRRIVLVEDDAAVALLLANLLRQQGATVLEFTDGREARDAAQRERPDLVITGARVPNVDGFSLCRELARDPLLADVPALLLPAKDQLLTRPRELTASTELHADVVEQVVASAERLLRPRAELEAKLRRHGEVRGSLEGTGVIALLRSVRRARPDARIRIRDAWNLFECELREGRLAQITRTASDGSFVRNERALPQLLGTVAGRFTVGEAEGSMKVSLEGTLDEVLTRGARELASELDAVTGSRLSRVARVVFDEDAYALLIAQTPEELRQILERLYSGESPGMLVRSGAVDALTLEPLLSDMVRRGALRGVIGSAGEDLIAEARAARAREQPPQLASPLSMVPPPPNPVISMLPAPGTQELAVTAMLDARDGPELPGRANGTSAPPMLGESAPPPPQVTPAPLGEPRSARVREANTIETSELAAMAAEARRSRSTLAAWTVALLALAAVGFIVAREPDQGASSYEALGGRRSEPTAPTTIAPAPAPAEPPTPTPTPTPPPPQGARASEGSLISAEDNGFTVYDGILDPAAAVPPDRALLLVEATPSMRGATIFLNDRELGAPPQQLVLPEGVHELAIKRGDAISYRFVAVHPGRTWVLRNP